MKLKVGDKVSFLNEKGGGIVTKILDDEIIHVTIEDGFDIPVMAKDVIKTGFAEEQEDTRKTYKPGQGSGSTAEPDDDMLPLYLSHNSPDLRPDGMYFAFVPEIQENPLTGSLDIYLINHTKYYSVFSLFLNHSGNYHGTEYGFIDPESRLYMGKIGRTEIEKWANAMWQSVFFCEDKCNPLPPMSQIIAFRPIKLYKEESFKYESLLHKNAFIAEVCKVSDLSRKSLVEEKISKDMLKTLEEKIKEKPDTAVPKKAQSSFLDKHKIDDKIAEVDLHIGELIDNFSNIEKNELLLVQLDYFKKCMQQAEKERLNKVIFIHGVGNGKLKTEIYKILDKTTGIDFYDASYARYGMGATEVNFYRNK